MRKELTIVLVASALLVTFITFMAHHEQARDVSGDPLGVKQERTNP